jgi:hypothetical protein
MTEKHDIPAHLIPSEDTVIAASDDEIQLNKELDTERWVYKESPEDGLCPYCGKEYHHTTDASQVVSKGVCPYPVNKHGDFIIKFVHEIRGSKVVAWDNGTPITRRDRSPVTYCGPEYADTLVSQRNTPDYDIRDI